MSRYIADLPRAPGQPPASYQQTQQVVDRVITRADPTAPKSGFSKPQLPRGARVTHQSKVVKSCGFGVSVRSVLLESGARHAELSIYLGALSLASVPLGAGALVVLIRVLTRHLGEITGEKPATGGDEPISSSEGESR